MAKSCSVCFLLFWFDCSKLERRTKVRRISSQTPFRLWKTASLESCHTGPKTQAKIKQFSGWLWASVISKLPFDLRDLNVVLVVRYLRTFLFYWSLLFFYYLLHFVFSSENQFQTKNVQYTLVINTDSNLLMFVFCFISICLVCGCVSVSSSFGSLVVS